MLEALGIRFLRAASRLEIAGWVNQREGLIEVFACAPGGKTHESVVVLDCVPSGLHAGLLALGLEPGAPAGHGPDGAFHPPRGDRVLVTVRWSEPDGRERTARAEDWIRLASQGITMQPTGWVFTGSCPDPEGRGGYAADLVQSLITTYHDVTTVLENPRAGGGDDTGYEANDRSVPAVGTPIVVSISAER